MERAQNVLLKTGRYAEAAEDLAKALSLGPRRWWLYKRRADACFRLDRFDEALKDLRTALDIKPDDLSTLGWIPPQDVAACPDEELPPGYARSDGHSHRPSGHR